MSELCHCGRPLRHTGRHVGSPKSLNNNKPKQVSKARFKALVEIEIGECHATISKLKGVIQRSQLELAEAEAKLKPLVALLDTYSNLALAAPAKTEPVPPPVKTEPVPPIRVDVRGTSEAHRPVTINDLALLGKVATVPPVDMSTPIAMDFEQIKRWCDGRGMKFTEWADLPKINISRNRMGLNSILRK